MFIFSIQLLNAQIYYWEIQRNNEVPVIANNQALSLGWAGGLNNPQFSSIDLNNDGVNDLFIFDKTGNRILAMNKIPGNNTNYELNQDAITKFPAMRDWALLRDFNCDGKPDIFTYQNGGSRLFNNTSTAGEISFELVTDKIQSRYSINPIGLYISPVDLPAIVDLDGDGDLDILTFNLLGGCVEFHKNRSVEFFGVCDSLNFKLEDNNWGKFREGDFDNSISLNTDCGRSGEKHSGSVLLTLDVDANGALDLVLGDIDARNLTVLINQGTSSNALMTSFDVEFPQNYGSAPKVDINIFPASYYLDVDGDGIKDLVVSPNASLRSENVKSAHFYKNLGQDNLPNFQLITESFLQEQMIDFGDGAYPLFYDLDGDGLKDLIVGNYGYFFTQSEFIGKVAYLKNTGTIESPEFTLITDDLAQISQYGFFNVYPTLGDLNGNGKPELLIGDGQGSLHLFDLQNFNGDFPVFTLNQGNYFGIVNNAFAAPELYDVNNDGLLDILCGGRNGKIAYYENKGNASTPQFLSMPDDSDFGQINVVDNTVSFNGYSHPRVFEWNDERHLFVGSFSGRIFHYIIKNQEVISQPTPLSFSHEGIRVAAAFADLNNNGLPSFVLGNFAGGLSFYNVESFFIGINEQELKPNFDISFFPNPASDFIFLKEKGGNILWEIVTLDGKVIAQGDYSNSIINVSNLKSGIYFLKTIRNGKVMVEKMIKR